MGNKIHITKKPIIHMRTIWKVTSGELLTKQETSNKKLLYAKNMHKLWLLLNVVTA
jgi:hypothetical protein